MKAPANGGCSPPASHSVAVVIPSYNMAWCLERAVASCLSQTSPPAEIIIVDDCSPDNTSDVIQRLMSSDSRIRSCRLPQNSGHLAALLHGLQSCTSDWAALLDADDELIGDSLQTRVEAAKRHYARSGEWPQLVYGDLYSGNIDPGKLCRFKSIQGHGFRFLSRELSLCQTSTIMLGRDAIAHFPPPTNPYNTDDEIVLAVAKRFPLVHAETPVSIAHAHASETRMTNSSRRRLRGITQLVRDHSKDIIQQHGAGRLFLWRLRILRAFLEWQNDWAKQMSQSAVTFGPAARLAAAVFGFYARLTKRVHRRLTSFLRARFEQIYF